MIEAFFCLATTLYFEARGEEPEAMAAVGHVIMNRVYSNMYPDTVCDVVRQGGERKYQCQFTWYCDGLSDSPKDEEGWNKALTVAATLHAYPDQTDGALWYHADYVQPQWAGPVYYQIGTHKFYNAIYDPRNYGLRKEGQKVQKESKSEE